MARPGVDDAQDGAAGAGARTAAVEEGGMIATTSLPVEQTSSKGSLQIEALGPDLLLFTACGHLSVQRARLMVDEAERLLAAHPKIHAFHDWEKVTGYDLLSRVELTRFLLVNRQRFASAHLLVTAADVAYGVEVANIVLRNKIVVHRERASFDAALCRARPR